MQFLWILSNVQISYWISKEVALSVAYVIVWRISTFSCCARGNNTGLNVDFWNFCCYAGHFAYVPICHHIVIVNLISPTHIHQTGYLEINPTTNSFALSVHVTTCLRKQWARYAFTDAFSIRFLLTEEFTSRI